MLKLISLNIETNKHYHRVLSLLNRENPDVICLQEATKDFVRQIQNCGYDAIFTTRKTIVGNDGNEFDEGLLLASKFPFEANVRLYHKETLSNLTTYQIESSDVKNTGFDNYSYIIAKILVGDEIFNIATTHLMVTPDGFANEFQTKGASELLSIIRNEEAHVICGDFNMPRGYNLLYNEFTKYYTDEIPLEYKSNLDKNLHRCGNLKTERPIFDEYMVDYIFTQAPYQARNVRLEFGVSDHAAIIAEIYK